MIKTLFILILLTLSSFACGVYEATTPIADVSVNIDAKKDKTTFKITWEFKENLLADHDKNQNKIFDKDEQAEIREEYVHHLEHSNYITEIVYVKKGQRVKKNLIQKIKVKKSKLTFWGLKVKYYYEFDTNFKIKKDHRIFIRFLDPSEKITIALKEVKVNNYKGELVIIPQDIRANIYFYNYIKKYKKYKTLKDALLLKK